MERNLAAVAVLSAAFMFSPACVSAKDTFSPSKLPASESKASLSANAGNNMPLLRGELDGVPCTLLFDTGATHTTFDINFIKENLPGCTLQKVYLAGVTNVEQLPSLTHAGTLKMGEAEFGDFDIMLLDMGHLASSVGAKVDGVLGMNIIGATRSTLSLTDGTVAFNLPKEARKGFKPARRVKWIEDPLTITLSPEKGSDLIIDSASTWTFLDHSYEWPLSGEEIAFGARDINGRGEMRPKCGNEGEMRFGSSAKVTIKPLIVEEPLNRLGADTLKRYDLLIEPQAVGFKDRSVAPEAQPEMENTQTPENPVASAPETPAPPATTEAAQ